MSHARLRPYCLRCYAPLEDDQGHCQTCSHSNPVTIRQKYWTQEPWLVRTEAALKIAIFGLALVTVIAILMVGRRPGWMAQWSIAVPFFIAFPLWMTVSCLTARASLFNPVWFWSAVFVLSGLFLVAIEPWLGVIPIVLIVITVTSGMSFRRWKAAHVLAKQAALYHSRSKHEEDRHDD